jgi:hypothetical protein
MISEITVVYIVWGVLFYLIPLIVFAKRAAINEELATLTGLILKPLYNDKERKIISINHNYDEFFKSNTEMSDKNFAWIVLSEICRNIKAGNMVQTDYYISKYRRLCNTFVGYIFLSAQIPFIYNVIQNGQWGFSFILITHTFACVLVIILKMYSEKYVSKFTDNLYRNWYDKLLNFDLIVINDLKPSILNALHSEEQNNLHAAINSFDKMNGERNTVLSQSIQMLSDKLDEFIIFKKDEDGITPKTIADSLENSLEKLNETATSLISVSDNASASVSELLNIANSNKEFLNIVNKNAKQITDLKKSMENYNKEALREELSHLQKVTETLDNSINNAYISIENTVTRNTEELIRDYEQYFSICERFSNLLEENYETGTIEALDAVSRRIATELDKNAANSGKLAEVIKATAESTEKLTDSVYDLARSSNSSNFIEMVGKYTGFTQQFNETQAKLISYESLIKLFETNAKAIENQDEIFRQIKTLTALIEAKSNTADLGDPDKTLKDCET